MLPKSALLPALALFLAAAWLLQPRPAEAGGEVGNGSAITCQESALNARLAGGGLLTFNCGPSPIIITLTSRKLITLSTTLDGGGLITLDGVNHSGLFQVDPGAGLELKNITLARGQDSQGGAIRSSGVLTVSNSLLRSNGCSCSGGAIFSDGALLVQGSTFLNNSANLIGSRGGAIYSFGTAIISSSSFSGSFGYEGGAIDNSGQLTLLNTTFTNNRAGFGGALANDTIVPGARLTVTASTFISNVAILGGPGGALLNYAQAAITATAFISNSADTGGAIDNGSVEASNSQLSVTASTFVSNTAGAGGGLANFAHASLTGAVLRANRATASLSAGLLNSPSGYLTLFGSSVSDNLETGLVNSGTLTITASTVAGNLANGLTNAGSATVVNSTLTNNQGAGLSSGGSANIVNTTVAGNQGGGLVNTGIFLVAIHNTLLAGNSPQNCSGSLTSLGHNLDDGPSCGLSAAGDLPHTNPLLLPLAANGGPTFTRALSPASPAINAGDDTGCPAADQRGAPRIGHCDIGAFESLYHLFLALSRR